MWEIVKNKKMVVIGVIFLGILVGIVLLWMQFHPVTKENNSSIDVNSRSEFTSEENFSSNDNDKENESEKEEENLYLPTEPLRVQDYIQDSEYKELDIQSSIVQDLYKKVTYKYSILNHYLEEKLTNDTIITLTLQEMEKNKAYNIKTYEEDDLEKETWNFKMDKFDFYAKSLFGTNVKYDIEKYNGAGNGCYFYYFNKSDKQLISKSGSGCGSMMELATALDFAYETEDKLVLIERTIFYFDGCFENVYCDTYDFNLKSGIYNNYKEHKLITYNTSDFLPEESLKKYKDSATLYAYTIKKENGNYYFIDFQRLN